MAVAADDGHARLGETLFRTDDVNDAALIAVQTVQGDAKLQAILLQLHDLSRIHFIDQREVERARRRAVIHGRQRPVRPAYGNAAPPQAFKGLGRGHLMDQVQIDVEHRRTIRVLGDDVRVPDFFE